MGGGGVVIWDLDRGTRLTTEPLHAGDVVKSLAFSPDGDTLAAGYATMAGGVVLRDVRRGRPRPIGVTLEVPEGPVSSVAFSPKGDVLAAGFRDGGFVDGRVSGRGGTLIWDVEQLSRLSIQPLWAEQGPVTSLAFQGDGQFLAAGTSGGITLYKIDRGHLLKQVERIANRNLTRVEWVRYCPDTAYRRTFQHLPVPPE
ncbi:WD40 repeat domain-containing protein [Paludisphaera soli]|uniref:WD40 repeat domain-containing protein n=1 Tax=Paludisphaera soli TaxID=2712865 RepID=UPI0036F3549D